MGEDEYPAGVREDLQLGDGVEGEAGGAAGLTEEEHGLLQSEGGGRKAMGGKVLRGAEKGGAAGTDGLDGHEKVLLMGVFSPIIKRVEGGVQV